MKKLLAFALCATILGACGASAWAGDTTGPVAGKTVKSEQSGKLASKKKKTKKTHKKKKKKSKVKSAGRTRHAKKA